MWLLFSVFYKWNHYNCWVLEERSVSILFWHNGSESIDTCIFVYRQMIKQAQAVIVDFIVQTFEAIGKLFPIIVY